MSSPASLANASGSRERFAVASAPKKLNVLTIDIGIGESALVYVTDNTENIVYSALIDGGFSGSSWNTRHILRSLNITKLDLLVITHFDGDHQQGIKELLLPAGRTIPLLDSVAERASILVRTLNPENVDKINGSAILKKLKEKYPRQVVAANGWTFKAGDFEIECLNGKEIDKFFPECEENDGSIALVFKLGTYARYYCAGDLTTDSEKKLNTDSLKTEKCVIKCGHHGSKFSTHSDFLKAVQPTLALIGCGPHPRFGHPSMDVIERLHDAKIPIAMTNCIYNRRGANPHAVTNINEYNNYYNEKIKSAKPKEKLRIAKVQERVIKDHLNRPITSTGWETHKIEAEQTLVASHGATGWCQGHILTVIPENRESPIKVHTRDESFIIRDKMLERVNASDNVVKKIYDGAKKRQYDVEPLPRTLQRSASMDQMISSMQERYPNYTCPDYGAGNAETFHSCFFCKSRDSDVLETICDNCEAVLTTHVECYVLAIAYIHPAQNLFEAACQYVFDNWRTLNESKFCSVCAEQTWQPEACEHIRAATSGEQTESQWTDVRSRLTRFSDTPPYSAVNWVMMSSEEDRAKIDAYRTERPIELSAEAKRLSSAKAEAAKTNKINRDERVKKREQEANDEAIQRDYSKMEAKKARSERARKRGNNDAAASSSSAMEEEQ